VLCIIVFQPSYSQQPSGTADKNKILIDSLCTRAMSLLREDPDSAGNLARMALEISEITEDDLSTSNALNALGNVFFIQGIYDSSLHFYEKSLELRRELDHSEKIAGSLNNIAMAWERKGNYAEAISYLEQALEIYRIEESSFDIGTTYGNIALLYTSMNEYDQALNFHKKEYPFVRNDVEALSKHYLNKGIVYSQKNEFDSAHYYYRKAIRLKEDIKDNYGVAVAFSSMAEAFNLMENADSALFYFEKTKEFSQLIQADHLTTMTNVQLAKIYSERDEYQVALQLLKESEDFLDQQETLSQLDAYLLFARIYEALGDDKTSIIYYEKFALREEEVRKIDLEGQLAEQKAAFYYRDREKENEYKQKIKDILYQEEIDDAQKAKTNLLILVGLILIIFTLTALFSQKILRKNKELIRQRKEINRLNALQEEEIRMQSYQLENSQKTIETYAYRNAHDLRGPLARILGILNLFEVDDIDKEDLWKRMQISARELEEVVTKIARELEQDKE
jgi:tetratricopeptide (TPR) repeat protein